MTWLIVFLCFQACLWATDRFVSFWLAVDQLLNVVIGSGWSDESLSAMAHRRNKWYRPLINGLFFWQKDHCRDAYYSEMNRRQLPPEYRK